MVATASRALTHDDLWSIPRPSDPQLSPDGHQVAYVVTLPDRESDDYRSAIWIVAAAGGEPRLLTNGPHDDAPAWSPDGSRLAFVGRRQEGKPGQIYIIATDGGEARTVTDLPLGAGRPVWSPNGMSLALAAPVDLAATGRPDKADQAGHRPVVVERLGYKADGAGLIKDRRAHLFIVDLDSSEARQLTFGDFSTSIPVWSPDGSLLAYTTSTGADRDLLVTAVVYSMPVTGGLATRLTPTNGLFHVADWSPDGETLLVFGQPALRCGHDTLFSVPANSSVPENCGDPIPLVPAYDRNVMPGVPGYPGAIPRYIEGGSQVLFCARDRGAVHVLSVPAKGGDPALVVGGDRVVGGLSASAPVPGGTSLAFVAATPTSAGEVWVLDNDSSSRSGERQLTDLFRIALPDVTLVEPRSTTFEAPDGTSVHGWMLRGDVQGPTPLLLDVHGGPHNAWGPVFDGAHLYHQTLVASGWTVLILNPRGSDGYGEDFWRGVLGAWGQADEADFLSAVDKLIADGLVDSEKVAITGYSYGGFMSCWLPSRTTRFAAAVSGGCVSNLVSISGASDLGRHIAHFELEAPVPEKLDSLVDMSPITRVASVRTPTLLLHGADDQRCPVGQAEEWFAALRDQQVPVEMVLYPGGSHLFILSGRPTHRIDYARRLESWVVRHTGDTEVRGPTRRVRAGDLRQRLEAMAKRHGVPGASVAVLAGDEVTTAAAGVLNVDTGVEATPDSLFQIGSVTKVYTATLLMQLVDEGKIDLDSPVIEFLPELRLGDSEVAKTVTLRHLLTHSSGIQGDHFPDTGRGDDCIARFIATCEDLGQSHPLGATMSYCNTGYVIAGRVIEQLTGQTWDEAIAERLFRPLGLTHTVTLPEEVLRLRSAVGHSGHADEPPKVVGTWGLPRTSGPAGLICSTAEEVITFARLHLNGGLYFSGSQADDGKQIISAQSVRAMQQPQVAVPDPYTLGTHWGLGWILFDGNRPVFGHDGNTIGQSAFLRIVPEHQVAIALLTNGGKTQDLYRELYTGLLQELADVSLPARPEPPATSIDSELDLDEHIGVYERTGSRLEVSKQDGLLVATTTVTGPLAALIPDAVTEHKLVGISQDLYVTRQEGTQTWAPMVFYRLPDGSPYVHFGARATPKVS